MYAVIVTGGKQYRVSPGEVVKVELLEGEPGKEVVFDRILMVSGREILVGTPQVEGAKVVGEVVKQGKADKVIVFKYRRRKHYQKKQGHRQHYTAVRIKEIMVGDQPVKDAEKVEAKPTEKSAASD